MTKRLLILTLSRNHSRVSQRNRPRKTVRTRPTQRHIRVVPTSTVLSRRLTLKVNRRRRLIDIHSPVRARARVTSLVSAMTKRLLILTLSRNHSRVAQRNRPRKTVRTRPTQRHIRVVPTSTVLSRRLTLKVNRRRGLIDVDPTHGGGRRVASFICRRTGCRLTSAIATQRNGRRTCVDRRRRVIAREGDRHICVVPSSCICSWRRGTGDARRGLIDFVGDRHRRRAGSCPRTIAKPIGGRARDAVCSVNQRERLVLRRTCRTVRLA